MSDEHNRNITIGHMPDTALVTWMAKCLLGHKTFLVDGSTNGGGSCVSVQAGLRIATNAALRSTERYQYNAGRRSTSERDEQKGVTRY